MKIRIGDLLKTSSPGKHIGELNIPRYPNDERLCIVRVMRHYLERSEKNFIYRDAETPQRGVARYYWKVYEITHVRGGNRHQHIQTPQHKDGIQECSIRAQTPNGYCSKDCWVDK